MIKVETTPSFRTRAIHFKNGIEMAGHIWLYEGDQPELVFQAHGFLQRRYELRLLVSKIKSFVGDEGGFVIKSTWILTMEDGNRQEFLVAGRTGLREALQTARSVSRSRTASTSAQSDFPRSGYESSANLPVEVVINQNRRADTAPIPSKEDSELSLRAKITSTPQLPGFKHLDILGCSTALKRFAQAIPRGDWGYGLDVEGTVISWEARTGLVSESQNNVFEPVRLPARRLAIPAKVVQIAGSRNEVFALTEDGDVWAWGDDYFASIGQEGRFAESPLQIKGLQEISSLASTGNTHFAISASGEVWSWGSASGGRLGDGSETDRSMPDLVPLLNDIEEIRCVGGQDRVVAFTKTGAVLVWGYEYSFEGDKNARSLPTRLIDLPPIRTLGDSETAIDANGCVWTWDEYLATKQIPGLTQIIDVVRGGHWPDRKATWHALDRDGRVFAWGNNDYGQIGDGTTVDRDQPVRVTGLADAVALVSRGTETYALTSDGTVYVWGGFPSERVLAAFGTMETSYSPVPKRLPLPNFTDSRMQRWATLELLGIGSEELRQTFFDLREGRTPLMLCAGAGHADEVSIMLTQEGDIDAVDADGDSALFYAASKGELQIVELLLGAGADPNIHHSSGGNSALAQAADMSVSSGGSQSVYWQIALMLLYAGADTRDMYSRGICPAIHTASGLMVIRQEHLHRYLASGEVFPIRDLRGDLE